MARTGVRMMPRFHFALSDSVRRVFPRTAPRPVFLLESAQVTLCGLDRSRSECRPSCSSISSGPPALRLPASFRRPSSPVVPPFESLLDFPPKIEADRVKSTQVKSSLLIGVMKRLFRLGSGHFGLLSLAFGCMALVAVSTGAYAFLMG